MNLSLDVLNLGVAEIASARTFYEAVVAPGTTEQGQSVALDMHGTGQVTLSETEGLGQSAGDPPFSTGFRGYVVSYILTQPAEVEAILNAAVRAGATLLKPAKGGFFGGFSASFQAPDGSVWKVEAEPS